MVTAVPLFVTFLAFLQSVHSIPVSNFSNITRVLLVSFDGFRNDYLDKYSLPNFQKVANRGVSSEKGMENVFATLTFPSHFSMATGLYQESHGIVGNVFFDRQLNDTFSLREGAGRVAKWWQRGEPIWITTTKAQLPSGTVFWPGSEVDYNGVRPVKWLPYNGSMPYETRVDVAVEWLLKEDLRFVTLYFEEPDATGHEFGTDAPEIGKVLQRMDTLLGYLLYKLEMTSLLNTTHVMIVSDHGMASLPTNQIYSLSALKEKADSLSGTAAVPWPDFEGRVEKFINDGTMLTFNMREDGNTSANDEFFQKLRFMEKRLLWPWFTVYTRTEMPQRWHYSGDANRVADVMILSEPGYSLVVSNFSLKKYSKQGNRTVIGRHGYDNMHQSMRPIFLMFGPALKKTPRKVNSIHQVDLYGLVCRILDVSQQWQRPNNGSQRNIEIVISNAMSVFSRSKSGLSAWTSGGMVAVTLVLAQLVTRCSGFGFG